MKDWKINKSITSIFKIGYVEWVQCNKRSEVWKYFLIDKKNKDRVKCKKCQHTMAHLHTSTSNMLMHLRHNHTHTSWIALERSKHQEHKWKIQKAQFRPYFQDVRGRNRIAFWTYAQFRNLSISNMGNQNRCFGLKLKYKLDVRIASRKGKISHLLK